MKVRAVCRLFNDHLHIDAVIINSPDISVDVFHLFFFLPVGNQRPQSRRWCIILQIHIKKVFIFSLWSRWESVWTVTSHSVLGVSSLICFFRHSDTALLRAPSIRSQPDTGRKWVHLRQKRLKVMGNLNIWGSIIAAAAECMGYGQVMTLYVDKSPMSPGLFFLLVPVLFLVTDSCSFLSSSDAHFMRNCPTWYENLQEA